MEESLTWSSSKQQYFKHAYLFVILYSGSMFQVGASTETTAQNFYDGCGSTKFCFGPNDCIKEKNCDLAVTIRKESNKFIITHALDSSGTSKYMASGFGEQPFMMNLAVLECVILKGKNRPSGFTSIIGTQKITPERTSAVPPIGIASTEGRKKVGTKNYFICQFTVENKFKIRDLTVDLKSKSYYLSVASGPAKADGTILKHGAYQVSQLVDFNKVIQLKAKHITVGVAHQVHGILMCIVYMTLMPIGRIVGRYYKETWSEKRIKGRKIWFIIHVGLMYLGAILAVVAYFTIAIAYQSWWPVSETAQNHAIVGVTSLACFFLQITIPWAISQNNRTIKTVYYKFHIFIGGASYALGLTNIILGSWWVSGVQPCETTFIVFVWIFFDLAFNVMLTSLTIMSDATTQEIPLSRSIISYPMPIQQLEEAAYKKTRVILLILLVISSALVTLSISVLIISLKPCVEKPSK